VAQSADSLAAFANAGQQSSNGARDQPQDVQTEEDDDAASLDAWILQNLDDAEVRTRRVGVLVAAARPFSYKQAEVLMAIGDVYDRSVD
jgi:hypothetical protein